MSGAHDGAILLVFCTAVCFKVDLVNHITVYHLHKDFSSHPRD
jgi:hypothetical protein